MINRNNYEEYFLLLADNELSPAEEAAVKQFAAKHPDLQGELDMLLSCRLEEEPMPVFPKEKLLRTPLWNAENPEPIHTQMLLLLDGELAPTEQQQLQTRIAASTALQAEWKSLQQTKLIVESIVHPNKESLRRADRKVRPLLWMRWVAAAAVVTGMGWLLWMQQAQKNTPSNHMLVVAPTYKKIPQPIATSRSNTPQIAAITNTAQPAQIVAVNTIAIKEAATLVQTATTQQQKIEMALPTKNVDNSNTTISTELITDEPSLALATLNRADVQLAPVGRNSTTQVSHLITKPVAVSTLTANSEKDAFAGKKEVLLGDENDFVTVGGAHINKQKVRGLFRNVTRSVARTFSKSKLEPDAYTTR